MIITSPRRKAGTASSARMRLAVAIDVTDIIPIARAIKREIIVHMAAS